MAGELVAGKSTYIARGHREPYELPDQHTAEFIELGSARCIALNTPDAGGEYHVLAVEETEDKIIVRAGGPMGEVGPGRWGSPMGTQPRLSSATPSCTRGQRRGARGRRAR